MSMYEKYVGKAMPTFVMACMLLVCLSVPGLAQEDTNIIVTAGQTTENSLLSEDISPHETIGGLVSSIESIWQRFVDFSGITIYKDEVITQEQTFDLFAFPTNSVIDANKLFVGDLFKVSETVLIGNVTSSWSTYEATSGADAQVSKALNEEVLYDDASTLAVNSWDASVGSYGVHATLNGTPLDFLFDNECTDAICGTNAEIEDFFDINLTANMRYSSPPGLDGNIIAARFGPNTEDWIFFGDLNKDGSMSLVGDGYTVSAQEGEALLLAPAGVYDIWGIIG